MLALTRVMIVMLAAAALSAAQSPVRVWLDTDPALGEPDRDVDDGFALVQAFRSPELEIRGVSVVFGNAPLDRGDVIARQLVRAFGPPALEVYGGAADATQLGVETSASRALASALRASPLTVIALGPATNVATVLKVHPELASRIIRVVAVAGRRPGQRFTTGSVNANGHRDFNFELDPSAFQIILDSGAELVLTPFEISSKIWIRDDDLDQLAAGRPAGRMLAPPARAWLALWRKLFAVDGFNPFDTLAVGYVARPQGFQCQRLPITIRTLPDDVTEPGVQGTRVAEKPYLLVGADLGSRRRAVYCSTAPAEFKKDLLSRLTR